MPNTVTAVQDGSAATAGGAAKKPLRFKIGVGLLILYPFLYLVIAIAPFLPLATASKGAVIAAVIGAAEVILLIAVALMGKEAYLAIKSRVRGRTRQRETADGTA